MKTSFKRIILSTFANVCCVVVQRMQEERGSDVQQLLPGVVYVQLPSLASHLHSLQDNLHVGEVAHLFITVKSKGKVYYGQEFLRRESKIINYLQ